MGQHFLPALSLYLLGCLSFATPLKPTEPPLFEGHPFVVIWNSPLKVCKELKIPLDTSAFQAVTTSDNVVDQVLTLFYPARLGLYPYVNPSTHEEYNGGIPQKGDLKANLALSSKHIDYYIPSASTPGLAVIDWESWRPLWARNWDSKDIYRKLSVSYAQQQDPSLSPSQINAKAEQEFQTAGRNYFTETLALGIKQRPKQLWGYYLFPDCYNYGYSKPGVYTGKCPEQAMSRNDELLWLWEASTALYPSVYLSQSLRNTRSATLYVRNRVQEAMRVAALPKRPSTVPIYVYSRILYRLNNNLLLSQEDLISSIGEIAALGGSGTLLWGDYEDKTTCEALSTYLTTVFNPYIANVTAAAKLCSDVLCLGNGRCVRQNYDSNTYLHLNPDNYHITKSEGKYVAVGQASNDDLDYFVENFTCQCYTGKSCPPQLPLSISQM